MKKYITAILLLVLAFNLYGQRKITGIVTDGNMPLVAVSITIKDTGKGTITDVDGNYNISVDSDAKVLMVSLIGYLTQEILIGVTDTINIKLEEDSSLLKNMDVRWISCADCHGKYGSSFYRYRPNRNVPTKYTMTGFVKDAQGNPLEGVVITHKISKKTAITDKKGIYAIQVFEEHGAQPVYLEKENSLLMFSYEGFNAKQIFVGKENIDSEVDQGTVLENSDSKEQIGDLEVGVKNVYIVNVYLAVIILEKK